MLGTGRAGVFMVRNEKKLRQMGRGRIVRRTGSGGGNDNAILVQNVVFGSLGEFKTLEVSSWGRNINWCRDGLG